jgi:uncharacterized protein
MLLTPFAASAQQPGPTVVTAGEGVVQAVPDRAWISVTAESRAANPREAQRKNAEAMKPVPRNTISLRIDNVDRVGELLDLVVSAGATSVDNIRFDLKCRDRLERDALRLAVADARARAVAAAAGSGFSFDRILRIEEQV